MLVPVMGGSDKTTVSVATGYQEYHPVYASVGNISNTARRAHGNGVIPVAFLWRATVDCSLFGLCRATAYWASVLDNFYNIFEVFLTRGTGRFSAKGIPILTLQ